MVKSTYLVFRKSGVQFQHTWPNHLRCQMRHNKTVKVQAETSLCNKPMVSPLQNSEAALSASDKELWITLQCICCMASNRALLLSFSHKYKRTSLLTEHLHISVVQELHPTPVISLNLVLLPFTYIVRN